MTIHFYVPKGFVGVTLMSHRVEKDLTLDGSSMSVALNETLLHKVDIAETVTAGNQCPNYNFSKLQKKGNLEEHAKDPEHVKRKLPYRDDDIIRFFGFYPQARDIITVRHRRAYGDLDLETVVRLTRAHSLAYTVFHGVFCRGPALFPDRGDFSVIKTFDGTFREEEMI